MMAAALEFLGVRGLIGLGVAILLSIALGRAAYMADHWHDQDMADKAAWLAEVAAHKQTIINYQQAAEQARLADAANVQRVRAEQAAINERSLNDYQARLADARARADRLRAQLASAANPGRSPATSVSGPVGPSGSPAGPAAEDGLSVSDRLVATEQAIQLDELIKWINQNLKVDLTGSVPKGHPELR